MKRKTFYILIFILILFASVVLLSFLKPSLIYFSSSSSNSSDNNISKNKAGFFEIKKVEIEGDTPFVSHARIKNILLKHVKTNFFDIDLSDTILSLDALPGITSTSIRRVWPDKLVVMLSSDIAFARSSKKNWFINPKGDLFESELPVDKALPIFQAPAGKIVNIIEFYNKIKDKFLKNYLYINKIYLQNTGDWEIFVEPLNDKYLKDPKEFSIQLGHRFLDKRIDNILQVYAAGKLNENKSSPKVVNLQYQNGFSVQWYS